MKRRTLDLVTSVGGLVIAGLLLVAGLVLSSNANFANTYVTQQLSEQRISFKTADTLTDEERKQACLVTYAGQPLSTGKQAECYANNFINVHLKGIAGGKTYAELGDVQTQLRAQIAAAQASKAENLADLQKQLTDVTANRETVFKGETLRGLLLTSYGFSEFGTKAAQAATVAYLASGLMFLLAIFGLIHAFVTPKTVAFGAPAGSTSGDRPKINARQYRNRVGLRGRGAPPFVHRSRSPGQASRLASSVSSSVASRAQRSRSAVTVMPRLGNSTIINRYR